MKRKWIKWVSWILLTPILLFVVLMVLLYVPPVQNFLRKQATSYASEATGMQINVGRIDLRFPLNLLVRDSGSGYIAHTGESQCACTSYAFV